MLLENCYGVRSRRNDRNGELDPVGFVGQMFKAIARFIAPANMPSPLLWGDEAIVRERLGAGVSQLNRLAVCTHSISIFPFGGGGRFPAYYGSANLAFASLDAAGRQALHQEWNRYGLDTTVRNEASRSSTPSTSTWSPPSSKRR